MILFIKYLLNAVLPVVFWSRLVSHRKPIDGEKKQLAVRFLVSVARKRPLTTTINQQLSAQSVEIPRVMFRYICEYLTSLLPPRPPSLPIAIFYWRGNFPTWALIGDFYSTDPLCTFIFRIHWSVRWYIFLIGDDWTV